MGNLLENGYFALNIPHFVGDEMFKICSYIMKCSGTALLLTFHYASLVQNEGDVMVKFSSMMVLRFAHFFIL